MHRLLIYLRRRNKINKKGFTLVEIVIVIVVLGILATLGFVQYAKAVEKSRTAEAKNVLSTIRTAQHGYKQQFGSYTSDMDALSTENVASSCEVDGVYFFSYSINAIAGTATRCTANGKLPVSATAYTLILDYDTGTFSGSDAAYY